MLHADIASMKPSPSKGFFGSLDIVVIPCHHTVAPNNNLTLGLTVSGKLLTGWIDDGDLSVLQHRYTLTRQEPCSFGHLTLRPVVLRFVDCGRTVGFGSTIDVHGGRSAE